MNISKAETKAPDSLWDSLTSAVQAHPRRIVLPEGTDARVLSASAKLVERGIAHPVVIGPKATIRDVAKDHHISLDGIQIIEPSKNPDRSRYIDMLMEIRKSKNLKRADAEKLVDDILIHGCLMLKHGVVDGFVGGASRTTADTVRSGLMVLGVEKSVKTVSGSFIMHVPSTPYGHNGWFVFADCAVVPHPTAEQLADIAYASSQTFKIFLSNDPRVAFLSFSSKGSAHDDSLTAIRNAVTIIKKRFPDIAVDGELQVDAALDRTVAAKKIREPSPAAGQANVLIFPDLNSGNIAYKITQRLAHAEAIGPILQGLNGAINDLSRGCTEEDIIKNVLITSMQVR
ncbi:MAG: phosphate acetyltransferase [Elusimicrobia bacterium]|nr:phosphate acetyltransferase [Elusimicrobiota bacterium]MBD3412341.1 phosphate acetyltransferase [Elusimicrobiota bacterium]